MIYFFLFQEFDSYLIKWFLCFDLALMFLEIRCNRDVERARGEGRVVAFRIQTQLETLEDGYKWRKYGKKRVKSNPNPR